MKIHWHRNLGCSKIVFLGVYLGVPDGELATPNYVKMFVVKYGLIVQKNWHLKV